MGGGRGKAEGSDGASSDGGGGGEARDLLSTRCQWLKGDEGDVDKSGGGPVLYWMFRDRRAEDNWALIKAQRLALSVGASLAVVVLFQPKYIHWGMRHFHFALHGLTETHKTLAAKNIPVHVAISHDPVGDVCGLAKDLKARAVVTDFMPLRDKLKWDRDLAKKAQVPVVRVDAHNVVPCWVTSDKLEYAARTIRRKVMDRLDDYLEDFPEIEKMSAPDCKLPKFDASEMLDELKNEHKVKEPVPPVDDTFPPGPKAGRQALDSFLSKTRLGRFNTHRNDPTFKRAISGLSPYFNSGQLSAQRAIMDAKAFNKSTKVSDGLKTFIEEAVVRRELSDNFCFHNPDYDNLNGAYGWARESLEAHAKDKREHTYSFEQLAGAKTHDALWNAAQVQVLTEGKPHGFMRMYWAKKVLEWTESPEQALDFAQRLNDIFCLDGNDPNGYVGVGWSVMGIHDQGWKEREVFGKIRYMNYNGCKRKFDVTVYEDRFDPAKCLNKSGKSAKKSESESSSKSDSKEGKSGKCNSKGAGDGDNRGQKERASEKGKKSSTKDESAGSKSKSKSKDAGDEKGGKKSKKSDSGDDGSRGGSKGGSKDDEDNSDDTDDTDKKSTKAQSKSKKPHEDDHKGAKDSSKTKRQRSGSSSSSESESATKGTKSASGNKKAKKSS